MSMVVGKELVWLIDAIYPEVQAELVTIRQSAFHAACFQGEYKVKLEKIPMSNCKILILQTGYGDFSRDKGQFAEYHRSLVEVTERKHLQVELLVVGMILLGICRGQLTAQANKNVVLRELCACSSHRYFLDLYSEFMMNH